MNTPAAPCPTCTGPLRETVGMVCQTCGTDYASDAAATDPIDIVLAAIGDVRFDDGSREQAAHAVDQLRAAGCLPDRRDEWGVELAAGNGRTRWVTFGDEGSARRFAEREVTDVRWWVEATVMHRWTYEPTMWENADA